MQKGSSIGPGIAEIQGVEVVRWSKSGLGLASEPGFGWGSWGYGQG